MALTNKAFIQNVETDEIYFIGLRNFCSLHNRQYGLPDFRNSRFRDVTFRVELNGSGKPIALQNGYGGYIQFDNGGYADENYNEAIQRSISNMNSLHHRNKDKLSAESQMLIRYSEANKWEFSASPTPKLFNIIYRVLVENQKLDQVKMSLRGVRKIDVDLSHLQRKFQRNPKSNAIA